MTGLPSFLVTMVVDDAHQSDLGRRYVLASEGTIVGNVPEAEIFLKLPAPLSCHVRIRKEGNGWYMYDLAEFSGASINGLLVQHSQIFDGDLLEIGPLGFEFCSGTGKKVKYFEQIENLLQEDFLTRAYNRSFLMNLLQLEIFRYNRLVTNARLNAGQLNPSPSPISLIFMDTDYFGQINKKYGHPVGDEVLRQLVKRIKSRLRTTDILARYGGEEFVVVLLDTHFRQAVGVAEDLRLLLEKTPLIDDPQLSITVTISGGVAELKPGMDVAAFVGEADEKARRAKTQGRNQIVA